MRSRIGSGILNAFDGYRGAISALKKYIIDANVTLKKDMLQIAAKGTEPKTEERK